MVEEKKPEEQEKTREIKRDKGGKFLPGTSGNPNGCPKFSLVSILKDLLKEVPKGEQDSQAKLLMREALKRALKGDTFLMRDIINRIDGLPRQSLSLGIDETVEKLKIEIIRNKGDLKPDADRILQKN